MTKLYAVVYSIGKKPSVLTFAGAADAYSTFEGFSANRINGLFTRRISATAEGCNREHEMKMIYIPGVMCAFINEDGRMDDYYAPGERYDQEDD